MLDEMDVGHFWEWIRYFSQQQQPEEKQWMDPEDWNKAYSNVIASKARTQRAG